MRAPGARGSPSASRAASGSCTRILSGLRASVSTPFTTTWPARKFRTDYPLRQGPQEQDGADAGHHGDGQASRPPSDEYHGERRQRLGDPAREDDGRDDGDEDSAGDVVQPRLRAFGEGKAAREPQPPGARRVGNERHEDDGEQGQGVKRHSAPPPRGSRPGRRAGCTTDPAATGGPPPPRARPRPRATGLTFPSKSRRAARGTR